MLWWLSTSGFFWSASKCNVDCRTFSGQNFRDWLRMRHFCCWRTLELYFESWLERPQSRTFTNLMLTLCIETQLKAMYVKCDVGSPHTGSCFLLSNVGMYWERTSARFNLQKENANISKSVTYQNNLWACLAFWCVSNNENNEGISLCILVHGILLPSELTNSAVHILRYCCLIGLRVFVLGPVYHFSNVEPCSSASYHQQA